MPYDIPGVERWVAEDTRLAQRVTLDALTGPRADDARRAAALTAKVRDARFPRVLSSGVHVEDSERTTYIVTERPRGVNGATLLGETPLSPHAAAALVGEAARALEAAAADGIHHGHLRPAALTVTPAGRVLVTGLGIEAALVEADASGEAVASQEADAAALAGLYALAVTGGPLDYLAASDVPQGLGSAGTSLWLGVLAEDPPTSLAEVSRALGPADSRALRAAAKPRHHDSRHALTPDLGGSAPSVATPAATPSPASAASASAPSAPTPDEEMPHVEEATLAAAVAATATAEAERVLAEDAAIEELEAAFRPAAPAETPRVPDAKHEPIEALEEIVSVQDARRGGTVSQLLLERLHRWWPRSESITSALERARERANRPAPFNAGPLVLGVTVVAVLVIAIIAFSSITTPTTPDDYNPSVPTHSYPEFTHSPEPTAPAEGEG
ncbi:hypothetical protein [Demequina sp. NBRC 110057]|uniref:hypothetical protein n=1 Tax=Demequina sp. NBRC 110057 TaxID=1570346 RepID=UPI001177F028|nr:hypothetical protein [Demequina sp. NBRC 110057]